MKKIEKLSVKKLRAKVAHYLRQAEVLELKSGVYLKNEIPCYKKMDRGMFTKEPRKHRYSVKKAKTDADGKYCQRKAVELMEAAERARNNAKKFQDRLDEIWESGLHSLGYF